MIFFFFFFFFLEHNGGASMFTSVSRTCFVHDVTSVINGATSLHNLALTDVHSQWWHPIYIQYIDRHTVCQPRHVGRSTNLCQSTYTLISESGYLMRSFTDQRASKSNCWKKCEKSTYTLIFVPKTKRSIQNSTYCILMENIKACMSIDIQYHNWHTISRSTYSITSGIQYLDRHTVSQLAYNISIDIHSIDIQYHSWHTISRSTYSITIGIQYLDRHAVSQLANNISIDIQYHNWHTISR